MTAPTNLRPPVLRIARPVRDLEASLRFYCDGLGFELLARFADHAGFSGVILGKPQAPYHFEFTTAAHLTEPLPTSHADDLIVFYLPDGTDCTTAQAQLEAQGHRATPSLNPWWDEGGRTYQDPDGYRVVLTRRSWTD